MRCYRMLALCVLTSLATAISASAGVRVSPSVASSLPGLPVDFKVELTPGSVEQIPVYVALLVTDESGEKFFARCHNVDARYTRARGDEHSSRDTLARSFDLSLGANVTYAGWLVEPRLWIPGTYRLQFVFADAFEDSDLSNNRIPPAVMTSDQFTLNIEEPQGAERVAWSAILEATRGGGFSRMRLSESIQIARKLWTVIPTSRYSPYVALQMNSKSSAELARLIEIATAIAPHGRATERLVMARALAQKDEYEQLNAHQHTQARASALRPQLEAELRRISGWATDEAVRANAIAELKALAERSAAH